MVLSDSGAEPELGDGTGKRARTSLPELILRAVPVAPSSAQQEDQGAQSCVLWSNEPGEAALEATSVSEFQERQKDVLKELHALYQKEHYALLDELRLLYASCHASGKQEQAGRIDEPTAVSHVSMDDDMQAILTAHKRRKLNAGTSIPVSPQPAPTVTRPTLDVTAACSAEDTSANRAVASLNNWMGAHVSSGTPQSGHRSTGTSAPGLTSSNQGKGSGPAPATTVPLTPIAEDPPSTPALKGQPNQDAADSTQHTATAAHQSPQPPAHNQGPGDSTAAPAIQEVTHAAPPVEQTGVISTEPLAEGNSRHHHDGPAPLPAVMHTPVSNKPQPVAQPPVTDEATTFSDAEEALIHLQPPVTRHGSTGGGQSSKVDGPVSWVGALPEPRPRFGGGSVVERVLKLEQFASAITEQDLETQDALACLVGVKGKYLIRQNTVLIGRSTEGKGDVDVDLSEEGSADKVSRRQAFLAVQADGQWCITNTGRRSMHVDGIQLMQFEQAGIQHGSMLEVGGFRFLLMVNLAAVERMLKRMVRSAM